jgi:hypothetical protein
MHHYGALLLLLCSTTVTYADTCNPPNPLRHLERMGAVHQAWCTTQPIVLIGSSTIELLGARVLNARGIAECNAGIAGAEIPEIEHHISHLLRDRPALSPAQFLAYMGENDLASGCTPIQAIARLNQFFTTLGTLRPHVPMVFVAQKLSPARSALWPEIIEFNTLAKTLIATHYPWITFFDLPRVLMELPPHIERQALYSDGLHFSSVGYEIVTHAIAPLL